MTQKSPVVVVLGHIDHGKSTLLDSIRKTNLTAKEAGGITQSIGAYQINIKNQKSKIKNEIDTITFIDTPGHEAFSKMRSHGAKAADIALLVIAADEGVKPQTVEAIKDIQGAKLPFIVVLNKIDRPQANPSKVKQELLQYGVFVEGLGGEVPAVEVSATKGTGVQKLLKLILLMAEVEELKADYEKPATGVAIASSLDSQRGVVATFIIKEGTLRQGEHVKLEHSYGKVRAMVNFEGKRIKEAGLSTPVEILGLGELPEIGEVFHVVRSLGEARREMLPLKSEPFMAKGEAQGDKKVLPFILKAKEKGMLDALAKLFLQVSTQYPETSKIISQSVGDISLSDIELACNFSAPILGFGIKVPSVLRQMIEQKGVLVKLFDIIYYLPKIVDEIIIQRTAPPKEVQEKSELMVLAVFSKSKFGYTIGGKVVKGVIRKGMPLSLKRDDSIIGNGKILNLQHLKKDVSSVEQGKECGVLFRGDVEVRVGDTLIET